MPIPIFSSLGSNYAPAFVQLAGRSWWASVIGQHPQSPLRQLTHTFNQELRGQTILVSKGRDAIELVLQPIVASSGAQTAVLTQGFACHAIEEGIRRAGAQPIYVDLAAASLSPSVATLEAAYQRAVAAGWQVKAVFLQYTLGVAGPAGELVTWARQHDLLVIEDLAQSYGAQTADGQPLGSLGDAVILSFGRDKVLDAVAGGAVVYRPHFWSKLKLDGEAWIAAHQPQEPTPLSQVSRELLYPWLTQTIRQTYTSGWGKVLFRLVKFLGLLPSPIATVVPYPTTMAAGYAVLINWQRQHLHHQLAHRRQVAQRYWQELQKHPGITLLLDPQRLPDNVHLRVAVQLASPAQLLSLLRLAKKAEIHLSDRWYRAVVDSGSLGYPSLYEPGTCPNAERLAATVLNLPTHHLITPAELDRIVALIKANTYPERQDES